MKLPSSETSFSEKQERVRISQRVKAGLETARAKGVKLGRPRVAVDARRIATLLNRGASWATVCQETGLSKGTAQRALHGLPKNPVISRPVSACLIASGGTSTYFMGFATAFESCSAISVRRQLLADGCAGLAGSIIPLVVIAIGLVVYTETQEAI